MSKQMSVREFMQDRKPNQDGYGDVISSFGESHLACALLLDVSGSMAGKAIESLNQGIRDFKAQVLQDATARERVDVALITFGSTVEVISDFVPITNMPTPALKAGGLTEMAGGIQTAIDMVKARTALYAQLGTPCHKPWIFMITDGASTSSDKEMVQAAEKIRIEEEKGSNGKLSFWALGIDNYNKDELFSLTRRVVELRDQDFSGIFNWLSESMATISCSHVGEKIEFDPLPGNARKARLDRDIDEGWY